MARRLGLEFHVIRSNQVVGAKQSILGRQHEPRQLSLVGVPASLTERVRHIQVLGLLRRARLELDAAQQENVGALFQTCAIAASISAEERPETGTKVQRRILGREWIRRSTPARPSQDLDPNC